MLNKQNKAKPQFDPDKFYLTKSEIMNFVSQVRTHWMKHPLSNATRLSKLVLFEFWIRSTNDKELHIIWKLMWKFLYELQYQNYLAEIKGDSKESVLGKVSRTMAEEIFNA